MGATTASRYSFDQIGSLLERERSHDADPDGFFFGIVVVMKTAQLGPLRVSRIVLGAMLMGDTTPPADAHRVLDRYLEAGGNQVDTADTYGDGTSERILAPWLAAHRGEVTVATKVRFPVSDPGGQGLRPDRIRAACDASLRRLEVEAIDLYYVHAPDGQVPIEDSLEALDGLVRAGKVRALGASNLPAWLMAWALAVQDREGWAPGGRAQLPGG
jgi:aryl-alcohol dehydrogenase-like predicted oxidoreductase